MESKGNVLPHLPQLVPGQNFRQFANRANHLGHGTSHYSQFTRIGHVPGGVQPLLREGGPISYEATPSAVRQPGDAWGSPATCFRNSQIVPSTCGMALGLQADR